MIKASKIIGTVLATTASIIVGVVFGVELAALTLELGYKELCWFIITVYLIFVFVLLNRASLPMHGKGLLSNKLVNTRYKLIKSHILKPNSLRFFVLLPFLCTLGLVCAVLCFIGQNIFNILKILFKFFSRNKYQSRNYEKF